MKDYLEYETQRNRKSAKLFKRILEIAFGDQGRAGETESVGHHISFQFRGDIENLNEIPSADTLLFDHEIMKKVFRDDALLVTMRLATVPAEKREAELELMMEEFL